jgi:hypothetical protein
MLSFCAGIPLERGISPASRQNVIALVEDPFIRKYLRDILLRHGYAVSESQANRVIQELQSENSRIDLVITNSPADFLAFANWLPILYLAAAPDLELASRFLVCRVLQKPFRSEALMEAVRDLTGTV